RRPDGGAGRDARVRDDVAVPDGVPPEVPRRSGCRPMWTLRQLLRSALLGVRERRLIEECPRTSRAGRGGGGTAEAVADRAARDRRRALRADPGRRTAVAGSRAGPAVRPRLGGEAARGGRARWTGTG